ncbi:hypothetical protein [Sphingomonas sp. Leaf21]|jgi:hypothetical protein|uniref:hypothetical protein n=1 Tax=Sphingomonas sp. Leaf21 TaxID=2876550 RepID=UPI001E43DD34|nr:hypothetical protein [Sphingomonas sp. Leaf21]
MLNIEPNSAAQVAETTRKAIRQYDEALSSAARLTLSFIAASSDTNIPVGETQKILAAVHKSQSDLMAARGTMVSAVSLMTSVQRRSNIAETSFGCPGPTPLDYANLSEPLRAVA